LLVRPQRSAPFRLTHEDLPVRTMNFFMRRLGLVAAVKNCPDCKLA
jgi:hypothetical protein